MDVFHGERGSVCTEIFLIIVVKIFVQLVVNNNDNIRIIDIAGETISVPAARVWFSHGPFSNLLRNSLYPVCL